MLASSSLWTGAGAQLQTMRLGRSSRCTLYRKDQGHSYCRAVGSVAAATGAQLHRGFVAREILRLAQPSTTTPFPPAACDCISSHHHGTRAALVEHGATGVSETLRPTVPTILSPGTTATTDTRPCRARLPTPTGHAVALTGRTSLKVRFHAGSGWRRCLCDDSDAVTCSGGC